MAQPTLPAHAMPLSELLAGDTSAADAGLQRSAVSISGLQLDSRKVITGDAFIAMSGESADGRNYIRSAVEAGAAAIVAESGLNEVQRAAAAGLPLVEIARLPARLGELAGRFYGAPSQAMHLVGVTGTNGKTTTSRLLAQLLRGNYGQCGVVGTLGATLGNEAQDALNTTPDAISLQRQLAQWSGAAVEHAVLEVSSHALVQGRVNGLAFDSAIFTNLSHDHLDYHGDMQRYGEAKSLLFQNAALSSAIVNRDDPYAAQLLPRSGVDVLDYSLTDSAASVYASDIHFHRDGLEARIETPWGSGHLHSSLAGDFNLSNLLAALTAACIAEIPLADALEMAPGLHSVAGRMQTVGNDLGLQLVVDYAHTPDALQQALQALRAHVEGQLICVFGCGGDRDANKRPVMGSVVDRWADRAIVTSDNPRGESPRLIIDDIVAGIDGSCDVEPDRARAIALAVQAAQPGDCVLVAGKGHESYQQVGEKRLPFSDVQQLQSALAKKGGGS